MKNEGVRIRVRENCDGDRWDYAVWNGKQELLAYPLWYRRKCAAVRRTKAVAKLLRIPYDPKMKKDHGC